MTRLEPIIVAKDNKMNTVAKMRRQIWNLFSLFSSFSSAVWKTLLYARAMKMAARSGTGIRMTILRIKERLDTLVPSKIMNWIVSIEKRKKKIPTPKAMRPERMILK